MRTCCVGVLVTICLAIGTPAAAQRYTAVRDGEVVRLADTTAGIVVSIVPSVGNIAFDMTLNGQRVLYWPYRTVAEFAAKPAMSGIPFMGPWANRLAEQAFYANGRRYAFDMTLGNHLDDVFSDLNRVARGRATMTVSGKRQRLDVIVGPNYRSVVVWAPGPQNFICFEPMAGITNAINMAHQGTYTELQTIATGGTWRESCWIRPGGF